MADVRSGLLVGSPRLIFVGVVVLSTLTLVINAVLAPEEWVGWVPTTVGAWESGALWTPSVIGVAAAWVVGQPRAQHMAEWVSTSSRPHHHRTGAPAAFMAKALVVALAASALVVGGISVYYGLLDGLFRYRVLLLTPGFIAYVFFWLAVGVLLGDRVRREFALPIAAVAPYVVYAAFVSSEGPVAALAVAEGRDYSYAEPALAVMAVRAVFWVSIAVAAWATVLGRRRTVVMFGWLTGFSGVAAVFVGTVFVPLPNATSATCAGTSPQVCLEVSFASAMPRYRDAVDAVWSQVPEPLRPDVVTSAPDVAPPGLSTLEVPPVAGYTEPSRIVDQTMFAARFGDALFTRPCLSGGAGEETSMVLNIWWRHMMGVPLDGSAYVGDANVSALDPDFARHAEQAQELAAMTAPERLAWFEANTEAIRDCNNGDFPG